MKPSSTDHPLALAAGAAGNLLTNAAESIGEAGGIVTLTTKVQTCDRISRPEAAN